MSQAEFLRVAVAVCTFAIPVLAFGQPPTASRSSLGTSLGTGADGAPRYREDSGWSSSNFNQSTWAVEYGTTLNGGAAWTSVLQAARTNAGLSAATNKLTLDLGGLTYSVKPYVSGGKVLGGQVTVVDRDATGAFLRLANGTLNNEGGSAYKTVIGGDGVTGRLFVDGATLRTNAAYIGFGSSAGSGASGSFTVESGGTVAVGSTAYVGYGGVGTLTLQGSNSSVTAKNVEIGNVGGTGSVVVASPTAVLQTIAEITETGQMIDGNVTIRNPTGSGPGLRVDSGTVLVGGTLKLPSDSLSQGSVQINGGAVKVAGAVSIGSNNGDTTGGRVYLHGGRLEVISPTALNLGASVSTAARKFYWKEGTLAFSGSDASVSQLQLQTYTAQGATSYGGDRGAGKIATGQTLEAVGTLRFNNGQVLLSGGTVRAGTGLVVDSSLSGYGTVDAVVSGSGAVAGTGSQPLSIGGLGGANAVTSAGGQLRVGHSGADAVHTGTIGADGQFAKVGGGTQTLRGQFRANDGVRVEGGTLVFDGNAVTTSPLRVSGGATARFQSAATGTVSSVTIDAGLTPAGAGRLQVDGTSTRLTSSATVTNNGWIELTNGGTLTVGAASPGQIVNNGHLINGGTLNAIVTGGGQISGSGMFTGAVTVGTGATLAPGNSPGSASFTDLTFGPGGSFELELANAVGTAGTEWDLAAVGDVLAITATAVDPFTVVLKSLTAGFSPGALAGFDPSQAYSWKFASVTDPSKLLGFDPSHIVIDPTDFVTYNGLNGGSFSVTAAPDGLYASFAPQPAAVPEPGSFVLLSLVGLGAAGWRARRSMRRGESSVSA